MPEKIGVVLYSKDSEKAWNAFRLANYALPMDDSVRMFLLGSGVFLESIDTEKFNVNEQVKTYLDSGGKIWACGTCLNIHGIKDRGNYITSTMRELYDIIKESDRILTF